MSELKPCPFCGEENTDTGFILHKDECYLMLRYMGGHSKHEMINAWNTRPIEDALQAEIDRLKAERRWIPVSERLPEDGLYWAYVYSCDEKWQQETIYKISHGGWQIEDYIKVSHWMPLLPPPEGEA